MDTYTLIDLGLDIQYIGIMYPIYTISMTVKIVRVHIIVYRCKIMPEVA